MSFIKTIKHNYWPLLLIAGGYLLQFLFISPIGEFALNDDWVHTDTLVRWVNTGEFRMLPFAGPTFYVPILYGAALVKLFGFSFSLLRISTLVLSALLLILFYYALFSTTKKPALAGFATLILWLNPLFYNLSFTFMTDIPSLFLLFLSLYLYIHGFSQKKSVFVLWGSLLCILGFFTRQTNIILLAAAGLYALSREKFSLKQLAILFGIPGIIILISYALLDQFSLLPQSIMTHKIDGTHRLIGHIKWWSWYIPMYLGLFSLPFTSAWFFGHIKKISRSYVFFMITGVCLIIALSIRTYLHLQMPYVINMINISGLGPMAGVMNGSPVPLFSSSFWAILTLLSAGSMGILIYILWENRIKIKEQKIIRFICLFLTLFILPILVFESFDRYLLPVFAVSMYLIVRLISTQRISYFFGICTLLPIACYSITQTYFYLQWNSLRWSMATHILREEKLHPRQIDGGYEWDGWHMYWDAQQSGSTSGPASAPWWIRGLFFNNTQDYIISWSPIPPYDILSIQQVPGVNPNNTLYLLKKPDIYLDQ